jgi:hypothetical protein
MQKNMPTRGIVMLAAVMAVCLGGWEPLVFAQKAFVEVTGQTPSYAEGDDGDIQAGVPFPKKRFVDKDNGTVEDTLTGLMWLKQADCFRDRTWAEALMDANTLADGRCGLTDGSEAGDWRLPNVKELQSLIDFGTLDPALPAGHPFSGVQSSFYWSSTTFAGSPFVAWDVSLRDGVTTNDVKDSGFFLMWPVRGGR